MSFWFWAETSKRPAKPAARKVALWWNGPIKLQHFLPRRWIPLSITFQGAWVPLFSRSAQWLNWQLETCQINPEGIIWSVFILMQLHWGQRSKAKKKKGEVLQLCLPRKVLELTFLTSWTPGLPDKGAEMHQARPHPSCFIESSDLGQQPGETTFPESVLWLFCTFPPLTET